VPKVATTLNNASQKSNQRLNYGGNGKHREIPTADIKNSQNMKSYSIFPIPITLIEDTLIVLWEEHDMAEANELRRQQRIAVWPTRV
jgi:hypothetical protein